MDRWVQTGGALGSLFEFQLNPIGARRRWRNIVERAQFRGNFRQLRNPVATDNLGLALVDALQSAIDRELRRQARPGYDRVNFAITAHGFEHAFQSINFTVAEFLERSLRLDQLLESIAHKLNSNESFEANQGFQVDIVVNATSRFRTAQTQSWTPVFGKRQQEKAFSDCH